MDQAMERLSPQDEAYLCLLCLKDSTERIAQLYLTYIKLRQNYSYEVPPVLFAVLLTLHDKRKGLLEKLEKHYPEYMIAGKWHDAEEQNTRLGNITQESRDDLHQICATEMRLLMLITEMMK